MLAWDTAFALNNAGAALTFILGILALRMPERVAGFAGLSVNDAKGRAEVRATYGGFFIALGAVAIWVQHPGVFALIGSARVAAAIGRVASMLLDRTFTTFIFAGATFELAIGVMLICH